jgi:hypothetical protein
MSLTFSTQLLTQSKEAFDLKQSDSSKMSFAKFTGGTAAKAGVFALASLEKFFGVVGSKVSSNAKWAGIAAEASGNMSKAVDAMNRPFAPTTITTTKGCFLWRHQTVQTIEGPTVASYIKARYDRIGAKAAKAKDFLQRNKRVIACCVVAFAATAIILYYLKRRSIASENNGIRLGEYRKGLDGFQERYQRELDKFDRRLDEVDRRLNLMPSMEAYEQDSMYLRLSRYLGLLSSDSFISLLYGCLIGGTLFISWEIDQKEMDPLPEWDQWWAPRRQRSNIKDIPLLEKYRSANVLNCNMAEGPNMEIENVYGTLSELGLNPSDYRFPIIRYKGQNGIDIGGLSRDFITRVLKQLGDDQFFDSINNKECTDNAIKGIAMILSRSIETVQPAGDYFPDWLLEMICSLSEEEVCAIDHNFEESWFWNRHNRLTSIQIKLAKILAKSKSNPTYQYCFVVKDKATGEDKPVDDQILDREIPNLLQGKVSQRLSNALFDPNYLNKKIVNAVTTICSVIKKRLNVRSFYWDECIHNKKDFLKKIVCGELDSDSLKQAFHHSAEHPCYPFMIQWITEHANDRGKLKDLVWAITGSTALKPEQVLKLDLPKGSVGQLPSFHTCFSSIDVPQYESYEEFKKKLKSAIEQCGTFEKY